MYQEKNMKSKKKFRIDKSYILLVSTVVLIIGIVTGTFAYLIDHADGVTNEFKYANVSCSVDETFNGTTKSDVKITNTGDTEAYIRARIIVTWKDSAGNVYGKAPVAGTDYTIDFNTSAWTHHTDGYYYCNTAVAPNGGSTPVLITSCTPNGDNAPEGYALSVEIIADAIQSNPSNAITEAWGYTIPSGT